MYDIISPDGFSFFMDHSQLPKTLKEAKQLRDNIIQVRYSKQGYYSSMKGRLTLKEAANQCIIKKITIN